jgi:hypothetical protein
MPDVAHAGVSPKDIEAILERAVKEPGINDAMALLELSQEANQIVQIRNGWAAQPIIAYVTGTAGWVK